MDVKNHAEVCPEVSVDCPFYCKEEIIRSQLALHLQTSCDRMMLTCLVCDQEVQKMNVETHDCVKCLKEIIRKQRDIIMEQDEMIE